MIIRIPIGWSEEARTNFIVIAQAVKDMTFNSRESAEALAALILNETSMRFREELIRALEKNNLTLEAAQKYEVETSDGK